MYLFLYALLKAPEHQPEYMLSNNDLSHHFKTTIQNPCTRTTGVAIPSFEKSAEASTRFVSSSSPRRSNKWIAIVRLRFHKHVIKHALAYIKQKLYIEKHYHSLEH